jgi:putative endonuclease
MPEDTRFVYVLKSADPTPYFYVGRTSDVPASPATTPAAALTPRATPWQLHVVVELPNEQSALDFERYLKSGSGRAFAKRHFG